jgi:prophage tail gpP-like protein
MAGLADAQAAAAGALAALSGDTAGQGEVTLAVDGTRYGGWLQIGIERSLDQFTDRFSFGYTDRWLDQGVAWPIREGSRAQVHYKDSLLVTGWINTAEWMVSGDDWSLSSSGRSLSGDLEDSSAIHASGHWKNKAPISIVKELISPFSMTATSTAADALLSMESFALQEAESVSEAIDRLCKQMSLLPVSKADGSIELLRADIPRGRVLTLPVHEAIERKVVHQDQDRHSTYYVIGQSRGRKNRTGEAVVKIKYNVTDDGVARHRPLVILADHAVAQTAQLKARAVWERNVRAGRAMRYVALFMGVLGPDGKPYTPGTHFVVQDEAFGVDDTLVLVSANIRASSDELVTEVELTYPAAYSTLTYPPKKKLNPKPRKPRPLEVCFPIDQVPPGFSGSF